MSKEAIANALPFLLNYEYRLSNKPPYATLETHTVHPAENGFEASAKTLMTRALIEIPLVNEAQEQINYYLDLAALQVALGENPADMITKGINLAPKDIVDGSVLAARRAGTILAYAGNFSSALDMARLASGERYRKSYPLRELAITIHNLGGDYQPAFEESLTALSEELEQHRCYSRRGKRSLLGLSVQSHIATAEALRLFGEDYISYLDKAQELLVEGGAGSAWAYKDLACAYARIGQYETAREFASQIRRFVRQRQDTIECAEEEKKGRKLVYPSIAYSQAGRGEYSDAIESACECGVPLVVCNVFLQQANHLALKGEDPGNAIERAILAAVESQPGKFTFLDQPWLLNNNHDIARIYAEAARIQALAGINPKVQQFITLSLIDGIQSADLRLETLLNITPTLAISGRNPNPLIKSALSIHDIITTEKGYRDISDLLNIHRAALFCGTTIFIDSIGERLTQSESEADNQLHNWARNNRPRYTILTAFAFTRWATAIQ